MTDFAETTTTPQQVQTRFAYSRNEHETASREIAEEAEFLSRIKRRKRL